MINITTDNFDAEVLKSPVPVLVDFWAPWCGACKMVEPTVEKLDQEFTPDKVKIVKLNAADYPVLAGICSVLSLPTFVMFKDGVEVGRTNEIVKERLEEFINSFMPTKTYCLLLNDMRQNNVENLQVVKIAGTVEELTEFYFKYLSPKEWVDYALWEDPYQPSRNIEKYMYTKSFEKDSPLEWFNPVYIYNGHEDKKNLVPSCVGKAGIYPTWEYVELENAVVGEFVYGKINWPKEPFKVLHKTQN